MRYVLLYFFLGAMWVSVVVRILPFVGLSARDDVVERGNSSAARAIAGAILAITLCFAGGNIGNGPDGGLSYSPPAWQPSRYCYRGSCSKQSPASPMS
jgi:hypothetical protein